MRPMLGSDELGPKTHALGSRNAEAYRFTATAGGPVDAISLYVAEGTTADRVCVGIYADDKGHPGDRLADGDESRVKDGAWNVVALDDPVSLTEGRTYWIGVLGVGGTLKVRAYPAGDGTDRNETNHGRSDHLPLDWRTDAVHKNDGPLSAYAGARNIGRVGLSNRVSFSLELPPREITLVTVSRGK